MKYKVSVIVPVYKAELYIEKCVQSILDQTLDSIEIILLDDGSPDRSGDICDEIAQKHDNVVVFHLENGGPSRARNIGLANANGKYVGFVDSDDYIVPNMYEILYDLMEQEQADFSMCSYFIDDGNQIRTLNMNYKKEYNGNKEIRDELASLYSKRYHNGLYSVCNKLFNNNLLQTNNIFFDEDLIRAEDAWFVFECLKVANKICFTDEALYYYRQVSDSTMHTIQEDRYERSKNFRLKVIQECEQLNIEIEKEELYYEFLYETFTNCRSLIKQHDIVTVKKILSDYFFNEACDYGKYLPNHLKVLCLLERKNKKKTIIFLLKLWSLG